VHHTIAQNIQQNTFNHILKMMMMKNGRRKLSGHKPFVYVWQLWGWSLQFGLGCWLFGNQPAALAVGN